MGTKDEFITSLYVKGDSSDSGWKELTSFNDLTASFVATTDESVTTTVLGTSTATDNPTVTDYPKEEKLVSSLDKTLAKIVYGLPIESKLLVSSSVLLNDSLYCKSKFKGSEGTIYCHVMPDIVDVKVFDSRTKLEKEEYGCVLPKTVVKLFFSDGTTETSVIDDHDYLIFDNLLRGGDSADVEKVSQFLMEQGISICITKKLLSEPSCGKGSSLYNKIVRRVVKLKKNKDKAAVQEAIAKAEAEKQRKEKEKKERQKKQRKQQRDYQRKVDTLAAALKKAFSEDN